MNLVSSVLKNIGKLIKKLFLLFISFLSVSFSIGFLGMITGIFIGGIIFDYYAQDLPDYKQLEAYDPKTVTRLYSEDGRLLAEYSTEKRIFVPISSIPKVVTQAFLSAEDKNFYKNAGIDFVGLIRAAHENITNNFSAFINGNVDIKFSSGGSTITQQVVKNFLLTNEKTIERKIKESILAMRISSVYSKDKILELYLNEIYLGLGSYGVAAAAQNYFNKSLDELTIEEAALLAAEPKSPSFYDPRRNYDATITRRNWVIGRMLDDGHINKEQYDEAIKTEITLHERAKSEIVKADFFADEVKRELSDIYGSDSVYGGGFVVKTTLDSKLQKIADNSLRKALMEYDRRHGYRGILANIKYKESDFVKIKEKYKDSLLENQHIAVVSNLYKDKAEILVDNEKKAFIPIKFIKWARKSLKNGKVGQEVRKISDVLAQGDVIIVSPVVSSSKDKKSKNRIAKRTTLWRLEQIPEINGAIVVMEPNNGRVLAMSGGYLYGISKFNRATQAKRQPGSLFKPFVYMSALESGFNPSTTIWDSPIEISQGNGKESWKPSNYHGGYLGLITMRVGLEKSRNTITVRLAQILGLDRILEIGKRFGIYDNPPAHFSIVLGAEETNLLRIVNAYSMIANGGKRVSPSFIERIDNRHGQTIYRRDSRNCNSCSISGFMNFSARPPEFVDTREQIADPRIIYQITSMLEGVAKRGTAARSNVIGKTVAGKTGTTNRSFDTWFVGFSPDLVVGVFIGYDKPRTLGKKETGSSVALPTFINFMKEALKDTPNKEFIIPSGIELVDVDLHTGTPAMPPYYSDTKIIKESFIFGPPVFVPKNVSMINESNQIIINPDDAGGNPIVIDSYENYETIYDSEETDINGRHNKTDHYPVNIDNGLY
ncbi:MAG: penicillin-binding protein 1A [Rickettsiales bacterium]